MLSAAMNLFSGMSDHEIISTVLTFALFNVFVLLEVLALAAFYVTSRPRRGRVRTASLWYIVAAVVFVLCLITTVWAAPAEKSFINPDAGGEPFLAGERFTKVLLGLAFALVGVASMAAGAFGAARQRRELAEEALVTA